MADLLALYRTFTRCVEAGSFSAVAAELNTSQPTISRQVAALEDHLGCLLFQRTTRALSLTDDGRSFYDLALAALDAAEQAEAAVGRRRGQVTGRLRLACAGVFGRLHVIPRLAAFMERHPGLDIDLVMQDSTTDLIEEGVDLALRVGESRDAGLMARRIGLSRRVLVATPGYLAAHGTPLHPRELSQHRCILYFGLADGPNWRFTAPEGPIQVPIAGRFRVDNTEGVRAAALGGLGIAYVPVWHFVDDEIESGQLRVILRDFESRPAPISAVWPSRRYLAPKVRAAIEFFAAECQRDPKLSGAAPDPGVSGGHGE
ncbi:MAG: LysR family transcriptional regulator [Roseomonas sp.]|nr:LysR family transcriptional regulator [Roseomonas sp.]